MPLHFRPFPPELTTGVAVEADDTGWVLHIDPGLTLPAPIRLQWAEPGETRLQVRAGDGSSVTLVESMIGSGERTHRLEMTVGEGAAVNVVSIGLLDGEGSASIVQEAQIGARARCTWHILTMGGKGVTHRVQSRLTAEDGMSDINWMSYARGEERYHLVVRNIFDGLRGGGEILMKGVAEEKAYTKAEGMIDIGLHGGGTNTYLTQSVLMLDPSAKIDAIPGLEIKTNDVKASHSATVSRVTPEDLFTFGARGIEPREARRMFVLGFLEELVGRIDDEETRLQAITLIEQKYAGSKKSPS